MIIDLFVLGALISAVVKGIRKGLIVAVFSVIAWIVGLTAAVKLSAIVAEWLGATTTIEAKWLPIAAFLLVLLVVVMIIRMGAKMLEEVVEFAFLGWVNKAGGILLYAALHILILSVILFFSTNLHLFSEETIKESITYKWVQPWGPGLINALGTIIPWFKDMFQELEQFFGHVQQQLSAS
ncbi:MAG: CvpA family protein [Chitinophagaceae bacterium]